MPDGPLIVDMTNMAKHRMQKRKPKESAQNVGISAQISRHSGDVFPQRISQRLIVTEAFYARFLAYFTSEGEGKDIRNRRTWLHSLPLLPTDGINDALVLAVQATAFAYCAVESGDMALRQHSWKPYGEAPRKHTGYMFRPRQKHEITVHMVSVSVLCSFFEAMQATNADAYCSHIYGAAKMLEITKPRQCLEGVHCQIFFHLKTQLAFIPLTGFRRGEPVQVCKILSGTLEYVRLPMFQRLMGHISTLANTYMKQRDGQRQIRPFASSAKMFQQGEGSSATLSRPLWLRSSVLLVFYSISHRTGLRPRFPPSPAIPAGPSHRLRIHTYDNAFTLGGTSLASA